MPQLRLHVVIVQEEDGGFSAFCPDIDGCFTQGDTLEETKANIVEAIQVNLEHLRATGQALPTLPVERSVGGVLLPRAVVDGPLAQKFHELDQRMSGTRHDFDLLLA